MSYSYKNLEIVNKYDLTCHWDYNFKYSINFDRQNKEAKRKGKVGVYLHHGIIFYI